jgi:hypothetical protein
MQVTAKSTGFDETDVLVWYAPKAAVYRLWGLEVREETALVPLWFCTDMVNERRGVYLPARRLLVCSWAEMDNLARGMFDDLKGQESGDVKTKAKTFALRVDVSQGLPVLQNTLPFEAPGLSLNTDLNFDPRGKRVLKIASRGIGPPGAVPRLLPKVPESYIQPGDDTNAHWAAHFPQTTKKEATRKLARVLLAQKAVMNAMKQEEGVVVMFPSFFEMFVAFTGLDRVGFEVEPLSKDRLAKLEMAQAPAGFKIVAVMFTDRDGLPVDYFCSYWNLQ